MLIEAGTVLNEKYASTSLILVEGTLQGIGTSDNPIIFTDNSDPLVGQSNQFYWEGITVEKNGQFILEYGEIRYAGTNAIYNKGNLDISNSKIIDSKLDSIKLYCSQKNIRIENNEIIKSDRSGVNFGGITGGSLVFRNNKIQDCKEQSILVCISNFKPDSITGGFEFNTTDGIRIYGSLPHDFRLYKNTYVLSGGLTVPKDIKLTIDAGSTVICSSSPITVEGKLSAEGTAKEPVVFTSKGDPQLGGDGKTYWKGFDVSAKGSLKLNYTDIRYPGWEVYNAVGTAISCQGTLEMNNSSIKNSKGDGIRFSTYLQPILKNNSFIDIANYSVKNNRSSSFIIDATNNYWGSASGPALYDKTSKTWSADSGKITDGIEFLPFQKKPIDVPVDPPLDTGKWSLIILKNSSNENTKIYTLETNNVSEKVTIVLNENEQTAVKLVMNNGRWVESPQLSANTLSANTQQRYTQGYTYWVQWFSNKSDSVAEKKLVELLAPDVRTKITTIFGEKVLSSNYQMIERGISDSINDNLYNGIINKAQSVFRPTNDIMYARAKMITDAFFVAAYLEAANKPISLVLPYVGDTNKQELFLSIIKDNNTKSLLRDNTSTSLVAVPLLPVIAYVISAAVVVIVGQGAINAKADDLPDLVSGFRKSLSKVFENETSMTVDVSFTDTTITIEGVDYEFNMSAEEATADMQKNKDMYYPALLSDGKILVIPVAVDRKTALAIMNKNDREIGIFSLSSSYARGLCNSLGGAIGPESHGGGEGYWSHYHGVSCRKAHCWYVI